MLTEENARPGDFIKVMDHTLHFAMITNINYRDTNIIIHRTWDDDGWEMASRGDLYFKSPNVCLTTDLNWFKGKRVWCYNFNCNIILLPEVNIIFPNGKTIRKRVPAELGQKLYYPYFTAEIAEVSEDETSVWIDLII